MMEAVCTSETSVNFNVTTWRYIPKDSKLHRESISSALTKCLEYGVTVCVRARARACGVTERDGEANNKPGCHSTETNNNLFLL
jgi:hypothetical protein